MSDESSQTVEETKKVLSVTLTEVGFEVLGHYSLEEYPEQYVIRILG